MSKSLGVINTATDGFQHLYDEVNLLLSFANTEAVSVNSTGAYSYGFGYVTGQFGANTLLCTVLGGASNLVSTSAINVVSNVSFLASQINVAANANFTGVNTTFTGNVVVGGNFTLSGTLVSNGGVPISAINSTALTSAVAAMNCNNSSFSLIANNSNYLNGSNSSYFAPITTPTFNTSAAVNGGNAAGSFTINSANGSSALLILQGNSNPYWSLGKSATSTSFYIYDNIAFRNVFSSDSNGTTAVTGANVALNGNVVCSNLITVPRLVFSSNSGISFSDGSVFYKVDNKTLNSNTIPYNSATFDDTTSFTNAFSEYEVYFENIIPISGSATLYFRVYSGTLFTGSYTWSVLLANRAGAAAAGSTLSATPISAWDNRQSTADPGFTGYLKLSNIAKGGSKSIVYHATHPDSTQSDTPANIQGSAFIACGTITGINFYFSSGNIASGIVKVRGLN